MRAEGTRSSRDRAVTLAAGLGLVFAVLLVIAVASGALISPDDRSSERAATPGTVPATVIPADRRSRGSTNLRSLYVGRSHCDDKRPVAKVSSPGTPWCSLDHAIEAAPTGSTVLVLPGRYGRLRISGSRPRQIVVRASNGAHEPTIAGVTAAHLTSLSFRQLRFSAPVRLSEPRNVVFDGNEFPGSTLYFSGASHVRVTHNVIRGLHGVQPAILFQGALRRGQPSTRHVVVEGNRIDGTQQDAIDFYHGYNGVTVSYNYISNVVQAKDSKIHADAVQLTGGSNLRLLNNRIERVTHGITIKDEGPTISAVIAGNLLVTVSGAGLQAFNAPGLLMSHNTIWHAAVSVILGNERQIPGKTTVTLRGNVFGGLYLRSPGLVRSASGNLFRHATRFGRDNTDLRGDLRFRDVGDGDYRLPPGGSGAHLRAGEPTPGTQLGPRPSS